MQTPNAMNSNYHQNDLQNQNNILRDKNHIDVGSKNLDENIGSGPYCVECAGTGSTLESEPCPRCKGTGEAGERKLARAARGIGIGMGLKAVFGWPALVVRRVIKKKKNGRKRREAEESQRQPQREDLYQE